MVAADARGRLWIGTDGGLNRYEPASDSFVQYDLRPSESSTREVRVRAIRLADIQPSLPTLTGIRADYLRGITRDSVVILDMAKIISDPRIIRTDTGKGRQ